MPLEASQVPAGFQHGRGADVLSAQVRLPHIDDGLSPVVLLSSITQVVASANEHHAGHTAHGGKEHHGFPVCRCLGVPDGAAGYTFNAAQLNFSAVLAECHMATANCM
jgi:hypothetical protein